jgi:hypothetical protein
MKAIIPASQDPAQLARLNDLMQQAAREATRNAASLLHVPYEKRGD